ncbi:FkbM family methyltransferase [Mucilaginibacter sp. UYCu711]|uniref:FkbM family methyltransferase n=1 Tax=Mucilaginibacter sp. UYCu711 TaxID=3156339 RepID=UPI003D2012A4
MYLKRYIVKAGSFFLPTSIKQLIRNKYSYSITSYSQEGEDLILQRIFNYKNEGFFIDVGAHHPTRFSNTYLFYLKGWRGINIDAMPGSMNSFEKIRPMDINIECPVSDKEEELKYYIFNESALNTFSEEEAKKKNNVDGYYIIEEKKLKAKPLHNILSNHLSDKQEVDFLSIDVEGLDFQVLKSIDWDKVKPKVILAEDLSNDLEAIFESGAVRKYLKSKGYKIFAKTVNTVFYKLED